MSAPPAGVRIPQDGLWGPRAGRAAGASRHWSRSGGRTLLRQMAPAHSCARRTARCPPRRKGRCYRTELGSAASPLTQRAVRNGRRVRVSRPLPCATRSPLYQRTRIALLQRESPHATYIDSYSSRGFVVNGNRVLGPCALLPLSVVQWNVGSHQDITEESFSLFWMLEPRIEIVVVGTGDRTERLPPQVLRAMRQRGIAVEVQDTPNACATFNFLCHEGRVTGAALIPPPGGTVLTSPVQAAA
uniref:NADH dehydrogenase [ubiquinone] 1 alpha subcomplex assembly factor 3 n=2 Tax=Rousettus aegyptiacus TaxID=9407 RepID=A0A7J8HUG4_ROUAE|nr:NADH:ubiquinone oxidoreductase complex assembly factor 3 [Rousettus aegyptiacus]